MMRWVSLLVVGFGLASAAAAQAPVPEELLHSRLVWLEGQGVERQWLDRAAEEFYKAKRFILVRSAREADVIVTLRVTQQQGLFVDPTFYLSVRGASGGALLWNDFRRVGWTYGGAVEDLVKDLHKAVGDYVAPDVDNLRGSAPPSGNESRRASTVAGLDFSGVRPDLVTENETIRAQGELPVIPVFVSHTGEDVVGRALAFELREALRRSAGYSLSLAREDGGLTVSIVTLDPDDRAGDRTVVSVALTLALGRLDDFIQQSVHVVGRNRTTDVARDIMAVIDQGASAIRESPSDIIGVPQ